jgi:glycosyltransferase involved in cell wall biosynthesis
MTIIHIITAFGIGGAEKLLLNTINEQVKTHHVHLIYLKPINELGHLLDKKVIVKNIPLSIVTVFRLNRYFKKARPDVIHTHLSHADILGTFAALPTKAKVFCTMHNIYFKKNWIDVLLFQMYRVLFRLKKIYVISISKCVKSHVVSNLKQKKEHSFLLYNAIPPVKLQKIKRIDLKKIRLLFVGRLEKQKSIHTLLEALCVLKMKDDTSNFYLTIVGEGSLRKSLEQRTKELQIEELVEFVGSQKDPAPYFSSSDIFALPSIWEGFGIVILEAFRAKLPVVASNIEGPSELIQDNVNGLLFEKGNAVELSKKIGSLILDKNKRYFLGENGYKSFTEKYHIKNYVEELNRLYENA